MFSEQFSIDYDRRESEPGIENKLILKKSDYAEDVLCQLNLFREHTVFTDAVLVVNETEFPCHRNVLAVTSPYFKAMFSIDLRESKEVRIVINEVSPSTLGKVLDYAYTGRCEINIDNAQDMLAAANLFQYPSIVNACCQFLQIHLHSSNCLGIEHFAQLHSCYDLEIQANCFALENFSAVTENEEFKELSVCRLLSYLSSDFIDVRTEETVFDAVMQWVKYEVKERIQYLSEILENVRLTTISQRFLQEVVDREPLIQGNEKCLALVQHAKCLRETDCHSQLGQRRRSINNQTITPRPSTVAKEVMILVGGFDRSCNTMISTVEMYDPHKDKWFSLPDMLDHVTLYAVCAQGNNIYVTGGVCDNQVVNKVWCFDTSCRHWQRSKPMLNPRARHASASWNNKVYVLGGISQIGDRKLVCVESIECYDAKCDEWTLVGTSPMPRNLSNVVPYRKTLVEIGGTQSGAKAQTMESYVCSDSAVKYTGEQFVLPEAIQFSQIVVLNFVFYIIWEDTKKVIALNPEKKTFRRLPDMHYAHVHSGSTVLDGKIFIAGGLIDSKPSRIIECYDPTSNTWTLVKSMKHARARHGCVSVQMC